jgi:hypothetical protein
MKQRASKLDQYAERLDELFMQGQPLKAGQEALAALGVKVSLSRLSDWWSARQTQRLQDRLMVQITSGARQCQEVEQAFGKNPAPELETIIKLHRVLALQLATTAAADPAMIELAERATKMAMEFAKIQDRRRELELSEQKYRDQVAERKAAIERELNTARSQGGLSTETIEKIERELKLF